MSLKSGLHVGVVQGHWELYYYYYTYDFILVCHCKYRSIFDHFQLFDAEEYPKGEVAVYVRGRLGRRIWLR